MRIILCYLLTVFFSILSFVCLFVCACIYSWTACLIDKSTKKVIALCWASKAYISDVCIKIFLDCIFINGMDQWAINVHLNCHLKIKCRSTLHCILFCCSFSKQVFAIFSTSTSFLHQGLQQQPNFCISKRDANALSVRFIKDHGELMLVIFTSIILTEIPTINCIWNCVCARLTLVFSIYAYTLTHIQWINEWSKWM